LCEESCPFGAIKKPEVPVLPQKKKETEIKRLGILLILLPVIVIGSGWVVSRLHVPLSSQHAIVSLAQEIHLENTGKRKETTEQTRAFRASGQPTKELFSQAAAIQNRFKIGGWILGGFLGLIICLKLIGFSIRRKQVEYEIDTGTCLSCGRCFEYCPYEQVRLGIISPDEIDDVKLGS
jgi:ferredoxin